MPTCWQSESICFSSVRRLLFSSLKASACKQQGRDIEAPRQAQKASKEHICMQCHNERDKWLCLLSPNLNPNPDCADTIMGVKWIL